MSAFFPTTSITPSFGTSFGQSFGTPPDANGFATAGGFANGNGFGNGFGSGLNGMSQVGGGGVRPGGGLRPGEQDPLGVISWYLEGGRNVNCFVNTPLAQFELHQCEFVPFKPP